MFTQIVKDPNAGIGVLKIASLSFKKAATPAALSFLINMQHGLSHNTKKAPKIGAFKSAADRNRTGTGITTHGILSPGRLPVPPLRHMDGDGFEPSKQFAADLQSVPFGHSGIRP